MRGNPKETRKRGQCLPELCASRETPLRLHFKALLSEPGQPKYSTLRSSPSSAVSAGRRRAGLPLRPPNLRRVRRGREHIRTLQRAFGSDSYLRRHCADEAILVPTNAIFIELENTRKPRPQEIWVQANGDKQQ
jgi:hypothetical protein